jgi:hypothetical protein
MLDQKDVAELEQALLALRVGELEGSGLWPRLSFVNESISILADPRFLHDWD